MSTQAEEVTKKPCDLEYIAKKVEAQRWHTFAAPGEQGGPCPACDHYACQARRQAAASPCERCRSQLGYGKQFEIAFSPAPVAYTHRHCPPESERVPIPKKVEPPYEGAWLIAEIISDDRFAVFPFLPGERVYAMIERGRVHVMAGSGLRHRTFLLVDAREALRTRRSPRTGLVLRPSVTRHIEARWELIKREAGCDFTGR